MLNHPVKINIKSSNKRLENALKNFYFYRVDETYNEKENQQIIQNIKESNLVIINKFLNDDNNDIFIAIGFHSTILFIQDTLIKLIQPLFSYNPQLKFYFLQNTSDIFDKNIIKNRIFQYIEKFEEQIANFSKYYQIKHQHRDQIFQIRNTIKSCISGYLIGESYFKTKVEQDNIFKKINQKEEQEEPRNKEWSEDEYIVLKQLGFGSKYNVELIYQIEKCHLYAIKKSHINDDKASTLNTREYENYLSMDFPRIPKLYGKQKKNDFLIIQYIHGQTLNIIEKTLTKNDKIMIVFELMLLINYLHDNNFVYRDLKPNNIIIDENKTVFLIDFDRMINLNSQKIEIENITKDFQSKFSAPEVNYGDITCKNDIYSLGMMIEYLQLEKENDKIHSLYQKCINYQASQRPFILQLIKQFYSIFSKNWFEIYFPDTKYLLPNVYYCDDIYIDQNKSIYYLLHSANQNDPKAQYDLGIIYYEGKYIERDINKSIYYLSLSANQNYPKAQHYLGYIYYEGKYIQRDINKSIYYLSLSANQNDPDAQFNLGNIYYEGIYIEQDINKAIYYLSLSANQNNLDAQCNLGFIYYEGKYIKRDINKTIYYLSLAANQNYPKAQYSLGFIYYEGKYIKRDINKTIYYLSLAANQNEPIAQCNLGFIYYEGKYIKRDINKSIYYLSLAANQNDSHAQSILGFIYYDGKYVERDINKSIYYLTHAANQNEPRAQYNLGYICYAGKYIKRNINKSIYYLSLAANQNHSNAQYVLGVIYYDGKYIKRDINKSIYYLLLSANQNNSDTQCYLGKIYYEGEYIKQDINKSIYYYSLAANQNDSYAQLILGFIYYDGKYIERDVNKSIHYLSLSANQNEPRAQYNLGYIYYAGKYIKRNINKSIYYLSLAASQNHSYAHLVLFFIYYEGKYIKRDINKSIHYLTISANQNNHIAQYILGLFYSYGFHFKKNMIKAIDYYNQSASKGFIDSHFAVGYFYHEGKHVERDIKKAIHHYKEASTFNNQYAKNNLGVIYRYGCGNEIPPNCGLSMDYFDEAIRRFKDNVSMYNLSHIYIYEDKNKSRLKKSIEYLIESAKQNFSPSRKLLCIALIELFGFNIEIIMEELNKLIENSSELPKLIYDMIVDTKILYEPNYKYFYESLREINYIYYFNESIISTKLFNEKETALNTKNTGISITQEFYEGFGIINY